MPSAHDPIDEIALLVAGEKWDDILASRPASPMRTTPESGWELDAALSLDFISSPQSAVQSPRTYKRMISSRFCHVCGRNTDKVRFAACGRVKSGLCRKVICENCCSKSGLTAEAPLGLEPVRSWTCTHCRGICIPTAQCSTYGRTNFKRHLALRRRRREKSKK